VLIAANLRPAVASVGPVLGDISRALGLSSVQAAALTTVPVVCFGVLAPAAPALAGRLGMHRALAVLLLAIAVGLALRVGGGVAALFAGTIVAAAGIAAANVLVPAVVKRDFPHRIGLLMGVYTTALTGAAALAAGLTVPLGRLVGHGWRAALGVWALPAALALCVWLPQTLGDRRDAPIRSDGAAPGSLLRDRIAWSVTGYFGLQSLIFYAVLSWLPTLYREHGYSPQAAGGLLSLSTLVQAPVALIVPLLAARAHDQRLLVAASACFTAAGLGGILLAPTAAAVAWMIVLGIGQGSAFPIALTLIVLRASDSHVTARLSAMAQSAGYVIAGLGPLAVGAVRAATGSWRPAIGLLLAMLILQLGAGLSAARARLVSPAPARRTGEHPGRRS
jgi:MFS transporter, CP family, cyanate transporter